MFAPEKSGAINKKATEVAADLDNRHSTGCPYGVGSRQIGTDSGTSLYDRERSKYLALEREHRQCGYFR